MVNLPLKMIKNKSVSHSVRLFVTPWTVAHQAPLSMGFSRQEYWIGFCSVQLLSHVRVFATPWTAAHHASLSITNSRSLFRRMSIVLMKLLMKSTTNETTNDSTHTHTHAHARTHTHDCRKENHPHALNFLCKPGRSLP